MAATWLPSGFAAAPFGSSFKSGNLHELTEFTRIAQPNTPPKTQSHQSLESIVKHNNKTKWKKAQRKGASWDGAAEICVYVGSLFTTAVLLLQFILVDSSHCARHKWNKDLLQKGCAFVCENFFRHTRMLQAIAQHYCVVVISIFIQLQQQLQ